MVEPLRGRVTVLSRSDRPLAKPMRDVAATASLSSLGALVKPMRGVVARASSLSRAKMVKPLSRAGEP